MDLLRRLLPVVGANAIPVGGVFLAGWSGATALTLYWWENLLASLLVATRLLLHRALTGKRGYRRLQLGLQSEPDTDWSHGRPRKRPGGRKREGSFVAEFAAAACAATLVHGALLWWLLRGAFAALPHDAALRNGVFGIAAFHLLGFGFDLHGLRDRSFAWARELAQGAVNRVLLIHLVLIAGFWASLRGGSSGFFGPFAVLKAMADVGNLLARGGFRADPEEAPAFLAATMNRLRSGADFAADWRERKAEDRRLAVEDEETMPREEHGGRRRGRARS